MGCSERTEFANNVILVASKMSSISCLFVYVNSICLNITPITRTLENLLIFSIPTMAKYLEICPFISTKALKCVMVLEKAIKIYQGGLVGLRAWLGDCVHLTGGGGGGRWSAVWTLASHFRVSAVSVAISGIGVSRSSLAFSDMWAWSVGVLDTEAGLCYSGLLTSIGNPIRFSRL